MDITLTYDHPTTLVRTPDLAQLTFAINQRRQPVAFRGRVRDPLLLRQLLLTQFASMRPSSRNWNDDAIDMKELPDPVITVQPDVIISESFSPDGSCYARLTMPMTAFDIEGEIRYGTTNVDFNSGLQGTIQRLRSAQDVHLAVGAQGVTFGGSALPGIGTQERFERYLPVPDRWVRAFLEVQTALAQRPYFIQAKPVDLLSIIAWLKENYTTRSPQAIRYEMRSGQPISVVLEPWDERFTLRGATYTGFDRTVRLWGRRRLLLLRDILPYAQRVSIGILGRGLPHVYICHCGPYQFMLALSGWTSNTWANGASLDLLAPASPPAPATVARVYTYLNELLRATPDQISTSIGISSIEVERALLYLCRSGRLLYDQQGGVYRLRDLFDTPLDVAALFPTDERLNAARELQEHNRVNVSVSPSDRRGETKLDGTVQDGNLEYAVTVAVDGQGRIRYGRCECPFFLSNILAKGPCTHMLALRLAYDAQQAPSAVDSLDDADDELEDEEE